MSDLIERLRRTYRSVECGPGHSYFGNAWLKNVNPDGPEAAAEIERLRALNDELQGLLITHEICTERPQKEAK